MGGCRGDEFVQSSQTWHVAAVEKVDNAAILCDKSISPQVRRFAMTNSICSTAELAGKKCVPCEGGVEKYSAAAAAAQVARLDGWQLSSDATRISKSWQLKNFMSAMAFFEKVAQIAEQDQHHPDLHLESYRNVRIEIYTHAIGGLSENDFILAAKINQLSPS
jgi:4a-hydroxytetrahydrobiopterin dehydratase